MHLLLIESESRYVFPVFYSGISIPLLSADQFPHVSLGETSAPSGGVLRRQLMTLSIHHARGVWPYMTQRLYRLVQWVVDIWLLYNNFLLQLGLSSIATGNKNTFIMSSSCSNPLQPPSSCSNPLALFQPPSSCSNPLALFQPPSPVPTP